MINPKTSIGVIDYGAGNVENVIRAFEHLGYSAKLIQSPGQLSTVSHAVIPGVGSFKFGMEKLDAGGFVSEIQKFAHDGKPILGICLGMQLMATKGFEHGETLGLNLFPGQVVEMQTSKDSMSTARVPHTGWTRVETVSSSENSVVESGNYYFSHSFQVVPEVSDTSVIAYYERASRRVVAAIVKNRVFGIQFHPEKSGELGLQTLNNFGLI
jgi:glutamine amidotransferase